MSMHMKHRRIATEQAFMLRGIPKIPKMKAFKWDKRKCARWASRWTKKGRKA